MRVDKQLLPNSMESIPDGITATAAAAVSTEVTAATAITNTTTTTIAGNEAQSASGSGPDSTSESGECNTDHLYEQQQQQFNKNALGTESQQQQQYKNKRYGPENEQQYNKNRYSPENEQHHHKTAYGPSHWRQFQSSKCNSRPWQNGRRTHYNNNNWKYSSNYSKHNTRESYHNQKNSNWQHKNNNWNNSDSFKSYNYDDRPDIRRKPVKWSTRDNLDRTDYYRNSRRSREKSYEKRKESDRDQSYSRSQSREYRENRKERDIDNEKETENQNSEQNDTEGKPETNNDQQNSNKQKENSENPASRENSIERRQSEQSPESTPVKRLAIRKCTAKSNAAIQVTPITVKLDKSPSKSIVNDKGTTEAKPNPSEVQSKLNIGNKLSPVRNVKETGSINTYPQIQVRPLSELLKQEIIAVTQEVLQVDTPAPTPVTPPPRSVPVQIRRHTVSSAGHNHGIGESNINDRLANMDKESLKYIINNSDTIYNEHLKSQARRRLRDEIRRQLKAIEFEKPKNKPPKDLVEDEIVDAIKLPQLLLKEIEKCFGIDISEPKSTKENQTNSAESKETSNTETLECEKVRTESDSTLEENEKCNTEQPKGEKHQPEDMAKESSTDLMMRLKIAEQFMANRSTNGQMSKAATPQSSNSKEAKRFDFHKHKVNLQKKRFTSSNKNRVAQEESQVEAASIKMEMKSEVRASPDIPCIVLSSSEDEQDEEDVQQEPQSAAKSIVNQTDLLNSSNDSTSQVYQQKLKQDVEHVIHSFEKLILPQLKASLADRYRSNHSGNLRSQLHFISCVVTSHEHNPRTFSKVNVAKMQQNLKEADNRLGLEFLMQEIDNVVNEKRKLQSEPNQIINSSSKSAELASEAHQRNCSIDVAAAESAIATTGRASMPPTPPRNGTPTNVANPMRSLHAMPLGSFLGLDSTLPRLSPGNYALPCGLESNESMLQMGDTVMHNLLEVDRRLLENQNRRGFLEEMIMKFQKEKSDLEMITLELQSRKFLLLNSVISRTTTMNATPSSAVTPINSPPPVSMLSATSTESPSLAAAAIPALGIRKKRQRRVIVKRVKILSKRKSRGRRSKALKTNEDPGELEANEEQLEVSTAASIPEPIPTPLNVKTEPTELNATALQPDKENDAINKRATNSTPVGSPKRQRLTRSATLNSPQQPLAVIPPLPPPPPPPEPFANMSYELPRILQKTTPPSPSAEVPSNPNRNLEHYNYGYIPSGRLLNITSPITQIRIYKMHIIAASENGDVYVFNINNHKLERQIIKHSEAITNMFLCEQESYLYTTSLDGFLKKSSLENLERVMQTVYLKEPLQSIDIAWGVAFIGSRWGNLFTYNIAANKVMDMPLLSTAQSVIAVKATKEGARRIIMLGCKGNFVFLHDAASGLLLRRLSIPEGLNVYSLLLIDGHVFCGTQKNEVYKFEFASGSMCNTLSCGNGAVAMATYQDRFLLIGCYDGFIYVLNKETGMRLGRFNGPGRLVLALAIAGDKVVASSKDNSLEILEIPSDILNLEQSA